MEKIHRAFSNLDKAYFELSPDRQRLLERCLVNLAEIVLLSIDEHESNVTPLTAVANYTSKKLSDTRSSYSSPAEPNFSLRQLRNELSHGKSRKRFDPAEIRKYETAMWRALEKSASAWHPDELTKFLSYCLRTEIPFRQSHEAEPKKIVRIYKALYNAFDEQQKERAFRELTLRLFSEERFLIALGETSSK